MSILPVRWSAPGTEIRLHVSVTGDDGRRVNGSISRGHVFVERVTVTVNNGQKRAVVDETKPEPRKQLKRSV